MGEASFSSQFSLETRAHTGDKHCLCGLWVKLQHEIQSHQIPEDTHRGEAPCLWGEWAEFQLEVRSHQTTEDTHRGEALCLWRVWAKFQSETGVIRNQWLHRVEIPYVCMKFG
ncbi:unnamed protein product [Rangifer tarandus platyrhynchus]|uniref:Uncharacterized protein n=2 Tax=Rangifer tarandus platyrhynchus TaxID=3082113 RepID=A0ACB1KI32_RANTA|nr:unnamed protein product [Rangifer tarandus platyrhynchus]